MDTICTTCRLRWAKDWFGANRSSCRCFCLLSMCAYLLFSIFSPLAQIYCVLALSQPPTRARVSLGIHFSPCLPPSSRTYSYIHPHPHINREFALLRLHPDATGARPRSRRRITPFANGLRILTSATTGNFMEILYGNSIPVRNINFFPTIEICLGWARVVHRFKRPGTEDIARKNKLRWKNETPLIRFDAWKMQNER